MGSDEGGESADVAVVVVGVDVDAEGFEARRDFVFEFGERKGGGGSKRERGADDDLDVAAEGGGGVISDAEGKDGKGEIAQAGFVSDASGAAFEG